MEQGDGETSAAVLHRPPVLRKLLGNNPRAEKQLGNRIKLIQRRAALAAGKVTERSGGREK